MSKDSNKRHMVSLAQKQVVPAMLVRAQSLSLFIGCKLFESLKNLLKKIEKNKKLFQ